MANIGEMRRTFLNVYINRELVAEVLNSKMYFGNDDKKARVLSICRTIKPIGHNQVETIIH